MSESSSPAVTADELKRERLAATIVVALMEWHHELMTSGHSPLDHEDWYAGAHRIADAVLAKPDPLLPSPSEREESNGVFVREAIRESFQWLC